MSTRFGKSNIRCRLRHSICRVVLMFLMFAVFGQSSKICAATRIALVGSEGNDGVGNVLDMATALLGKDANLQLLDRAEVDRTLREQEFSLSGMVRAEDAVNAGQLLHVDLFAVLEGTLTNGIEKSPSLGLVVFDAKTGVRYADSALLATNTISAASAVAAAIRAADIKSRLKPQDLHTVGLLSVRNTDLPRQFDSICDSVGLLLERELTASPGIAVLERRRLEQINKERSVAPDAEGNRLLSSLRMMQLDISGDGEGLRGTLAFTEADGDRAGRITASISTRDPAALAQLLAEKAEQFLKAPADGIAVDRGAEAARFHHEYLVLSQHHDYLAAVHVLDAAIALSPEQKNWQQEMALLLPEVAIDSDDLSYCLALSQREADLLLDLSREATAQATPGEPMPAVLKNSYHAGLKRILGKLAGEKTTNPASAAEIAELIGKERTLLMEVIEPFLVKQSVDSASFETYSDTIRFWFFSPMDLNQQDTMLALSHWIEVSHNLNPSDGSGNYNLLNDFIFFSGCRGNQLVNFCKPWEQDQDPVISLYGRAGLVTATMQPSGYHSDETLAAERQFRLSAQDFLAHDEAAESGSIRNRAWSLVQNILFYCLINHPECGNEYLEASRSAFVQGDIQPILFYRAAEALERSHNLPGELEVVNSALKLILEKPEAYPKLKTSYSNRSEVIKDLQKKSGQLTARLSGNDTNVAPPPVAPWKQSVCLLDLATPMNGCGWLFQPVIQDGQVFTVALGVQEWGTPEDSLQLVRVPLAGGNPVFLGRAKFSVINPDGRKYFLARRLARETNAMTGSYPFVRAACVGAGCYFAATGSGVFIFPTNGGPVFHLDTTNGLPSDDVHAVAFLDGKLYIGAGEFGRGGYLAAYEPASRNVTIFASSRRSEHLSPLDDQQPFFTLGLLADSIRHRLIMAITSATTPSITNRPAITPSMGIWSYLPVTGEYQHLAPLWMIAYNPSPWRNMTWFGQADTNTVAVKELYMMALFDLRDDHLISSYDSWMARTNPAIRFWDSSVRGAPGNHKLADGPFFIRDGWFYSARPFERMALADGRREELPPLRTDYPFEPRESLQFTSDGNHILAADQISLWLLGSKPETAPDTNDGRSVKAEPGQP
jgi:hypothetical protein